MVSRPRRAGRPWSQTRSSRTPREQQQHAAPVLVQHPARARQLGELGHLRPQIPTGRVSNSRSSVPRDVFVHDTLDAASYFSAARTNSRWWVKSVPASAIDSERIGSIGAVTPARRRAAARAAVFNELAPEVARHQEVRQRQSKRAYRSDALCGRPFARHGECRPDARSRGVQRAQHQRRPDAEREFLRALLAGRGQFNVSAIRS